MDFVSLVSGMISLIDKNIIARTNVTSNVLNSNIVKVENSFHFQPDQEAVLIDYGYNTNGYSPTSHYDQYEYVRVKNIIDTRTIELYTNTISNWYVSDQSFLQKTIGNSPLYSNNLYYGDREVIPTDEMAVCIEPTGFNNEWIYLQGGLSVEYKVDIIIYGKEPDTELGMEILNKYTQAIYQLFLSELHIDLDAPYTPILANVTAGTSTVVIEDNSSNRENFAASSTLIDEKSYQIQDNLKAEHDFCILSVSPAIPDGSGKMTVTMSKDPVLSTPFTYSYSTTEYATLIRYKRYFYDTRVESGEMGTVQKGSAYLRAARLSWFGKEVEEWHFPQTDKGVPYFRQITP